MFSEVSEIFIRGVKIEFIQWNRKIFFWGGGES